GASCSSRGIVIFFFSSRRRHTRSKRDWNSDVCSSDLPAMPSPPAAGAGAGGDGIAGGGHPPVGPLVAAVGEAGAAWEGVVDEDRSEERRVGQGSRRPRGPGHSATETAALRHTRTTNDH